MAKAKKRELSIHSRAARRGGTSPPPKDSAAKSSSKEETDYKPWLHNTQSAGISKKKKAKQLSRQQRHRQQKGLEQAQRNVDKLVKKVADSKTRSKKIQARAKDWDELNEKVVPKEGGDAVEQVGKNGKDGGIKAMEGVEMPDLEQPLPIRAAEEMEEDDWVDEETIPAVEVTNQPITSKAAQEVPVLAAAEAVDDIS